MAQISRMGILTAKNGENPKQIPKDGKWKILKMRAGKFLRTPRAISAIVVQRTELLFGSYLPIAWVEAFCNWLSSFISWLAAFLRVKQPGPGHMIIYC
jgi:hypothetical protein